MKSRSWKGQCLLYNSWTMSSKYPENAHVSPIKPTEYLQDNITVPLSNV